MKKTRFFLLAFVVMLAFSLTVCEPPEDTVEDPVMVRSGSKITITTATEGARIRYTIDDTIVTFLDPVSYSPLVITMHTDKLIVRAQAFKDGWAPSAEIRKEFDLSEPGEGDDPYEGLYMGIIGFNKTLKKEPIGWLHKGNKDKFQTFITGLTMEASTPLYYAVDQAIETLKAAKLPADLANVSIVTFTDGLDNASIEIVDPDNETYEDASAYGKAVAKKIKDTKIDGGVDISAYAIGLGGKDDGGNATEFKASLVNIASDENNVFSLTKMAEVTAKFEEIAQNLNSESSSQTITLRIPGGYDNGAKMRFTFDTTSSATGSTVYIEGTYSRSGGRSLTGVTYNGLKSKSGATVTGDLADGNVTFTFNDVITTDELDMKKVQHWYTTGSGTWNRNSEFNPASDSKTVVEKKSAVIMLVLDCTTSLGNADFTSMKTAAKSFIDVLTKD